MELWIVGFILLIIKLIVVLVALLLVAGWMVWVERKLLGRFQVRFGPNRAGKFGFFQPMADIIKLLTKEDTVPGEADRCHLSILSRGHRYHDPPPIRGGSLRGRV